MKYLRIIILFLILCNVPSYALVALGSTYGSIISYSTFILIILYFFLNRKDLPYLPFIIIGYFYFIISILINSDYTQNVVMVMLKYFTFFTLGFSFIRDTEKKEIFFLLLIGALSTISQAIFNKNGMDRFAGVYLNPNGAGFASIIGFCISLSMKEKKIRLLGQFLFSISGLLTFSRTFLLVLIIVFIISIGSNFKNIFRNIFEIGVAIFLFSVFLTLGDKLNFNVKRADAFSSLLEGKVSEDLEKDSRTEAWASYYDNILGNPLGNGYLSLSGKTHGVGDGAISIQGVHNTFLMILGEAGIFVFLIFSFVYGDILLKSLKVFKRNHL